MQDTSFITRSHRTKPPKKERVQNALNDPVQIIRESHRRSLFSFIQYFWQDYSNDEFVPNWHIRYLCRQLEGIAKNVAEGVTRPHDLIVNIPPGTSKTATTSIFFPLWCWTQWHWMKFITASYGEVLSLESADFSRDIMRSQRFQEIYPELEIRQDKDKKSNYKIIKKVYKDNSRVPRILQGGNRFSTSVGGTLTGFHGHILIVDDPLDPNRSLSEKEIARANHWVSQTLSTRKANKLTATTIMIMQRLHQNDPSGALLSDPKKRIKHICIPGEITSYENLVNPPELKENYKDNLLDPVRMPWSVMKDLRADLGQYGYAGQIGQKPTPPGGGMFHIDNFQVVDNIDEKLISRIVRYWDKAGTQGDGAYTAGVKMAKLKTGQYVILDVRRGQWSTDNRENIIEKTAVADGNHVHQYIEQEPGSGGKESAENTKRRLINKGLYCQADRPQGDKIYRADPFSVQVNEGNVWMIRADWNKEFVEEYEFFPFSTFKDQVDAGSGAFAKLSGKKQIKVL